jgi:hypothetical protein
MSRGLFAVKQKMLRITDGSPGGTLVASLSSRRMPVTADLIRGNRIVRGVVCANLCGSNRDRCGSHAVGVLTSILRELGYRSSFRLLLRTGVRSKSRNPHAATIRRHESRADVTPFVTPFRWMTLSSAFSCTGATGRTPQTACSLRDRVLSDAEVLYAEG